MPRDGMAQLDVNEIIPDLFAKQTPECRFKAGRIFDLFGNLRAVVGPHITGAVGVFQEFFRRTPVVPYGDK
jgi:hypothetical protein